jgi:ABC-type glycerol-3-phosphate transport system permease component
MSRRILSVGAAAASALALAACSGGSGAGGWVMVLSAFKSNAEIAGLDQTLLPRTWTFENFVSMQENFDVVRLFGRRCPASAYS